ncbi:MAG: hypothetical protein KZQ62_05605 [Candidatus Thiodiazotropha sp. (ex Lucinoma aequizonata)]|nr:hypothetical protein [Candidatus Thiodiazotropha sp. (ex Lucinoma aequizonata)]
MKDFGTSQFTKIFHEIEDTLVEEMMLEWKKRFALHTLVINADNGPESSGRRTQWLKRLTKLSDTHQPTIQLAYYPLPPSLSLSLSLSLSVRIVVCPVKWYFNNQ